MERAILFEAYVRQEADAASDIYLTDILCIAEELYSILGKPVGVYELWEINPTSAFYDTILAEGMQSA